MKHRLFKKFKQLDFNEYYSAQIGGDVYYGIASVYFYALKFFGIRIPMREEQYFHTMKIPLTIMTYLTSFLSHNDPENAFSFRKVKEGTRSKLVMEIATREQDLLAQHPDKSLEIHKEYQSQYDLVYGMFDLDWSSPLVKEYLKKGWEFMYKEYAGKATRNIWLGRTHDDVVTIQCVKLFGSPKDNEVVENKRMLMDKDILELFIKSVTA